MRKLIILFAIFATLVGCQNPIKEAKAARLNEATRQSRLSYNQRMSDNKDLAGARIAMKETFLYTGIVGGVILILTTSGAWGWYVLASTQVAITKKQITFVDDPQGNRFPLLIRGSDVVNISTGERFQIGQANEPQPLLVEASTRVQLGRRQQIEEAIRGQLLIEGGQ